MTSGLNKPAGESASGSWHEVAQSWRIVAAAVLAICLYSFPGYSFSVLVGPLATFFNSSKTAITGWHVFWSVGCIAASPFVGMIADRIGARSVLLVGMPLYAAAILGTGLLSTHLWQFLVGSLFVGATATIVSTVVCGRLISTFFDRGLGTALGLMTSGIGVSAVLGPKIMQHVVDTYGWQAGFIGLAAVTVSSTPIIWALTTSAKVRARTLAPETVGYSLREAARMPVFWLMGFAILVYGTCTSGASVNMVVFLTDAGFTRALAATLMGGYGLFTLGGRLFTGMLLDRIPFHVAKLMALFMALMGVSFVLIGASPVVTGIAIGLALFGALAGAEADCMAYGAVRVFGRRSFGAIYGTLGMGFYHVGIGVGPMAFSATAEAIGSYRYTFSIWACLILVAGVLFYLMSRTPYLKIPDAKPSP